ncbi:uncharacterized protein MICPUCDRAFT_53535 [Micromonas pusilla CCMP1545]|uniref:Predicted protein n=2 Tax=Micromonas pusilla TaxID=38833 RepID=C1N731_MICPC|nr:uncharacterized protein MICPUCDRAFT_53535 [Micromonas pusilla CCMP1545]EEH52035.1 predicted protein [Micromonas pusilla CCMP1545]|eukprot:XP_003063662.1 predicted protein [Micromonas pusilla CCMP1545]
MPDEDVDDGTDWITRTHDLKDGEEANLVLGAGFEREEVELMELPPELLAVIEEGGEMAFKGAPDEEAVLCTRDKTYAVKRVETSNTLLLLQPPGGLGDDDDDDDDDAEGAEGADGDRGTPEPIAKKPRKSAPSPKPRDPPETPAEACALALSQQKDAGGASDPNDPKRAKKDITAFAQASSHLELTLIAPRLDAMWARLQSEPHVYAGPERERELDDADAEEGEEDVAAAEAEEEGDADAANEDGAPRRGGRSSSSSNRGFDLEDLVENAQASEMEIIAALDEGPAFVLDGKWRGIEPSYLAHVMDVAIVNAQVEGWPLTKIPEKDAVEKLAEDGFPEAVTQHFLRAYCHPNSADASWSVDATKVCVAKASGLLDEPVAASGGGGGGGGGPGGGGVNAGRWRLRDFVERWRESVPEELRDVVDASLLRGLALVDKTAGVDGSENAFVRPFRADRLPKTPKERFHALFTLKPRWTMDELEPYVVGTREMTVEAQLLKFTRVSQPTADATPVYSKR